MAAATIVLQPNIKVGQNCGQLAFNDGTGVYNSILNAGGYGGPNLNPANVVSAVLSIMYPGALPTAPVLIDIFGSGFPTTNTSLSYVITASALGFTNQLPDGYYTVTYTLVDNTGNTYFQVVGFFVTCGVQCCVNQALLEVDENCCSCNKNKLMRALRMSALLKGIKRRSCVGDVVGATAILTELQNLCQVEDCGCGS